MTIQTIWILVGIYLFLFILSQASQNSTEVVQEVESVANEEVTVEQENEMVWEKAVVSQKLEINSVLDEAEAVLDLD